MYGKCPEVSNTLFHTFLAKILLFRQLVFKILSEMANSADPDQTADQGMHCLQTYAILSETLMNEILGNVL